MDKKTELHFDKPPISEAIFDIRVEVPDSITVDVLKTTFESVKDRFPEERKNMVFQGGIQFAEGGAPSIMQSASEQYGFSFRSPDGKRVAQTRRDGFTFNNLAPYVGWNALSEEAKELWALYKKVAKPRLVNRLALRYVNRIDLPKEVNDIKDYLATLPALAPDIPQNIGGFFMRVQVSDNVSKSQAFIVTTVEPSSDGQGICLIFDIDAFQIVDIVNDDNAMWAKFNELRIFKNNLFDKSFTSKAKELFR